MKLLWTVYWTARLIGHRVDPARNIIYAHRGRWRFVVQDGTFVLAAHKQGFDKRRLWLYTDPSSNRIERVRIA